MYLKRISILLCLFAISCASRTAPAPIENATKAPSYVELTKSAPPKPVEAATSSNVQPTAMSSLNSDDNSIKQVDTAPQRPLLAPTSPAPEATATTVSPALNGSDGFIMPTAGQTNGYKKNTKGVDIYGTLGQDIYASNSGKVVYSGNGLKDYGNLIIIKHSDVYLTAYAHNKVNLVKDGATVKRGQKIAEMGQDDSNKAVLHFELRKNGKPIDPFTLITKGQ